MEYIKEFFFGLKTTSNENDREKNTIYSIVAILLSFVAGTLYYMNMSRSIPTETNCSFQANIMTDILAVMFGIILIYYGIYQCKIPLLTFIGSSIIVEHFWQWYFNKYKNSSFSSILKN